MSAEHLVMSTQATTGAGEVRHTPGPWKHGPSGHENSYDIYHHGGWFLRISPGYSYHEFPDPAAVEAEFEANIRLIDAAPALREALADMLPGPLCGEAWDLPDTEKVSIAITFGQLRAARAALSLAMDGGTHAPSEQQEAGR